jgi:MFS family permease
MVRHGGPRGIEAQAQPPEDLHQEEALAHKRPPLGIKTLASLGYRDFVYLWLGQATHAFALWLEQTARPLLILVLTDSPVHLGGVIMVRTVPAVVFGMLAGVVADNFNRRTVLLTTKVVVLALSVVFAALVVLDLIEVWHIYLFSFLRGATMAFDQPARRAMIPTIVPNRLVLNAMTLSTGTMGGMRIAGAAAAGILMGVYGMAAPFVAIVFVYILAVIFTWMLRTPDHARSGYQGVRSMGGDLAQGLRFAWNTPTVRGVLIIAVGYFTFGMAFMQVFAPLFATKVLEIGETGYGLLISVMGVGSVLGSVALATANPTRRRGVLTLSLLGVFGVLLVVFAAGSSLRIIPLAFVLMAALGLAQAAFFPVINAMLVEAAPENMRGRVLGLLSLDRAMTAFGGFLAGVMAAGMGAAWAQTLFGAACVVTAVALFTLMPSLRRVN